jgi:hypothetical protein
MLKKGYRECIARHDIVVWKHVLNTGLNYRTAYRHVVVKMGKEYESVIGINGLLLSEGLHSYRLRCDASEYANRYCEALVKCVIPKGAVYYRGVFRERDVYASGRLRYVGVVKDYSY